MTTSNKTVWCLVLAALVVSSCSTIKPPRETWSTKSSQPYNDVVRLISVQAEKCWTKSGGWSHDPVVVETHDPAPILRLRHAGTRGTSASTRSSGSRLRGRAVPTRVTVLEGEYARKRRSASRHT